MSTTNISSLESWEVELKQTAYKYHSIVIWVAIILNPLWAIGDFFGTPQYFNSFLIYRLAVTALCALVLVFRKRLMDKPETIAFVPFFGISLQNAYMYSVMNAAELQKHTFAYIALFIGAGMLVLWDKKYSITIVIISLVANIIHFKFNSTLSVDEILTNGALLTATVAIFTIVLIQTRFNLTKKEIIARMALSQANEQLGIKNKAITDSINYAKNIQYAVVPTESSIHDYLPDSFVYYRPKDIVSGDFPFIFQKKDTLYVAAVDCTGHGVPGAFMSLVAYFSLNQTLEKLSTEKPGIVLDALHDAIVKTLGQDGSNSKSNDGMDIALCKINLNAKTVEFAGAHRPLYVVRNGVLEEIKSDKLPIGGTQLKNHRMPFSSLQVQLQKGDSIYFCTDGLQDQFGGKDGKVKFLSKNVKQLIIDNSGKSMLEFKSILNERFEAWKGEHKQMDDVLMIGCKF
jgi:phosphoserine phosphatase RsbU/P